MEVLNIDPAIQQEWVLYQFHYSDNKVSRDKMSNYLKGLVKAIGMTLHPEHPNPVITSATGKSKEIHDGYEGIVLLLESGIHMYLWEKIQLCVVNIHSCAKIKKDSVLKFTKKFFNVVDEQYDEIKVLDGKRDSQDVEIRNTKKGKGIFAKKDLPKDTFISGFYGKVHFSKKASLLPAEALNHAIQFSEEKYRLSQKIVLADKLNHSCNPNCGIKGLFDLVTMRRIKKGEELTWDYTMSENSDWELPGGKCLCGEKNCRGKVGNYSNLPKNQKNKYKGYISKWLVK